MNKYYLVISIENIVVSEARITHQSLPPYNGELDFCLSTLTSQLLKIN